MGGRIFNARDYRATDRVVMHCTTKEFAEIFTKYLESIGRRWNSGDKYSEYGTRFFEYGDETCYNFCLGTFSGLDYYQREGYIILEFEDFYWEELEGDLEMDVCADDVCCLDKFFGGFCVGV